MNEHAQPDKDESEYIFQLPLPARGRPKAVSIKPAIMPGKRYRLDLPEQRIAEITSAASTDGLLGHYSMNRERAEIGAVEARNGACDAFVWDVERLPVDVAAQLRGDADCQGPNRLTVHEAALDALGVKLIHQQPVLNATPRFSLEWDTEGYAAQLGVLQLVESQRSAHFAGGDSLKLLDTASAGPGPVLYLDDPAAPAPVKPVCAFQARGEKRRFEFAESIRQPIFAELDGKAVESITVLEQYTLHFLVNAEPEISGDFIWTPVHLPLVWGWSIRVQQRFDGVWDIFRKKLILPMPSIEAPPLPLWQSNSLRCRAKLDV